MAFTAAEQLELAEHLSDEERAELADLLERQVGGESLYDFICRIAPHEPPPRHLMPILAVIERARVTPVRICISMPPGHAKTTTLLRAIVWWLLRSPADTCAYVSYSQKQASSKSRIARELADEVGLQTADDSDSVSEWRTIHGGGVIAAGIEGGLTGQRVPGLLIYDDPFKNRQDANSPAIQEQVWNHFREAAFTRLQGGSIIVLHTRWIREDLIGRIVEQYGWEYLNIEAVANDNIAGDADAVLPPDPLGRAPGEAAWPEKYPVLRCDGPCGHDGHLEEIRGVLLEWSWAALYAGRPAPESGGMFKADWLDQYLDEAPATHDGRAVRGWDFAGSDDKDAAPGTAWTVGSRTRVTNDGRLVLEDIVRRQIDSGDLEDFIVETAHADGFDVVIDIPQDPGAAGKFVVRTIVKRLQGYTIQWSPESGSKRLRAEPLATQAKAKNFWMVRGPWNAAFKSEALVFPMSKLKDQIDATSRSYAAHVMGGEPETTVHSTPRLLRGSR